MGSETETFSLSLALEPIERYVAFRWKDYRQGGITKVMKLKACEFIRRFLLHALPDSFHRIRHFGFMANGHRAAKFALCRSLLADHGEQPAPKNVEPASSNSTHQSSADVPACPHCGGVMRVCRRSPDGCEGIGTRTSSFRIDSSNAQPNRYSPRSSFVTSIQPCR